MEEQHHGTSRVVDVTPATYRTAELAVRIDLKRRASGLTCGRCSAHHRDVLPLGRHVLQHAPP
jgi:hypothetical protein